MRRNSKFNNLGNIIDTINMYRTNRKISRIILHCSATPIGRDVDVFAIDRMHLKRFGKSSGCGYHYIIKLDGTIEKGRWVDAVGGHAKGNNRDTIGICYIGGVKPVKGKLVSVFNAMTKEQEEATNRLTKSLMKLYNLSSSKVLGHNELPKVHKDCPCISMDKFRANLDTKGR